MAELGLKSRSLIPEPVCALSFTFHPFPPATRKPGLKDLTVPQDTKYDIHTS